LHKVNKALPDTIDAALAAEIIAEPLASYTLGDSISVAGKEINLGWIPAI
jgi:hypothetical protein